jgi:hypothetical protein
MTPVIHEGAPRRKRAGRGFVWTDAEKEILRQEYPQTPTAELAKKLGKSPASVALWARRLGIARSEDFLVRRAAQPPLPESERNRRHKRFLVACVLAGPGSGERLAAELGVSLSYMLKMVRGKRCSAGLGRRTLPRSWRIETATIQWADAQIEKYAAILSLPVTPAVRLPFFTQTTPSKSMKSAILATVKAGV